jgi:hypothetical protein
MPLPARFRDERLRKVPMPVFSTLTVSRMGKGCFMQLPRQSSPAGCQCACEHGRKKFILSARFRDQ